MNIGILGKGAVGRILAAHLAAGGHAVVIGTRDPATTLAHSAPDGAGTASIQALRAAGDSALEGKVLLDISNPLDFSRGMPPSLFVCNTDSLGEQIQRAFPALRVVKTLNTVTAAVMVNPGMVAGADHDMFVSGNDAEARAQEMLLPNWLRLWAALGTPMFNIKVVR